MTGLIKKLKHNYIYDLPLLFKLLISHALLILLPTLVLTFFLYNQIYGSIVSETVLNEQNTASQAAISLDEAIVTIQEAAATIVENKTSIRLFSSRSSYATDETNENWLLELNALADSMIDGNLITDIVIYTDREFDYLTDDDLICPLSNVTSTYWYGIFSSQDVSSLLCSSIYLSVTEEESRGDLAYIQREAKDEGYIYVAIYFSSQHLSGILNEYINTENSASYIIDDRDAIVVSSDEGLSGAYYMSNSTLNDLSDGISKYTTSTYLGDNIYVGYFSVPNTSWHLVTILSSESLVKKGQNLVLQLIIIYFIFFVLALLLAITLSRSIAKRIATLSRQMRHTKGKKPARIASAAAKDEIGTLVSTYNDMSDEISDLLDKQMETAEELRLMEFRALQSQINPHFLYNTLDMVNWLAQTGQNQEVSETIQALSKFYKQTLNRKNESGTVGEELEHISLYIQLQNMRYEGRINFMVDVADDLKDIPIPKLTLQPIVENCIQHGIMEKTEKAGTILVTGWVEGSDLVLLISDDGVGMSATQIEEILSGNWQSKKGSNIGVYNTHARLQVLYGKSYGLSYESVEGEGTNTQIRVPAE